MADLQGMMTRQADLQLAFGNPSPLDMSDEQRMQYIKDMAFALLDEVHEAMKEACWKPWEPGHGISRDAFVSELIDAMQFLMNLFAAVGCSADEIQSKLGAKHEINWMRIRSRTAKKCSICRRALDDRHVECTETECRAPQKASA